MKVYVRGFNSCTTRRGNLCHYRNFLLGAGHKLTESLEDAEVVLLWTCGFRGDVLENSLRKLKEIQADHPGATVIAAGCIPDIDRRRLQESFSGLIIPWKEEARELEAFFHAPQGSFARSEGVFCEGAVCQDASAYRQLHPEADVVFHDQFFKLLISEGCPYNCTYCTEKLAFPPYRSFPSTDLVEACRLAYAKQPFPVIMFIADCLGEYGSEFGGSLQGLMAQLRAVLGPIRFALNNLHPLHLIQSFASYLEVIRNRWIEHINLPIQSASSHILELMDRQYRQQDLEELFTALREVGFTRFDTHLIVGFPGETNEDFNCTLEFMARHKPKYALISRFYCSPMAKAASLPDQVPPAVIQQRLLEAEACMKKHGIIYNVEGSDFARSRLSKISP